MAVRRQDRPLLALQWWFPKTMLRIFLFLSVGTRVNAPKVLASRTLLLCLGGAPCSMLKIVGLSMQWLTIVRPEGVDLALGPLIKLPIPIVLELTIGAIVVYLHRRTRDLRILTRYKISLLNLLCIVSTRLSMQPLALTRLLLSRIVKGLLFIRTLVYRIVRFRLCGLFRCIQRIPVSLVVVTIEVS